MTDDMVPPNDEQTPEVPPPPEEPVAEQPPETPENGEQNDNPDDISPRLKRLGGEPAPDITPEEFARLQQSGQIHIDPRGRVRTTRRDETDAGVSLRKRRAWY